MRAWAFCSFIMTESCNTKDIRSINVVILLEEGARWNIRNINSWYTISPYTELDRATRSAVQKIWGDTGRESEKVNCVYNWCREGNQKEKDEGGKDQQGCQSSKHRVYRGLRYSVPGWLGIFMHTIALSTLYDLHKCSLHCGPLQWRIHIMHQDRVDACALVQKEIAHTTYISILLNVK